MKTKLIKYCFLSLLLYALLPSGHIFAQNNALVLNGAYVILDGGTALNQTNLVVNQPNTSGIVRLGPGGHIHSENQYNYVKWLTSTSTGNYVIPFGVGGTATDFIPFTFNKTTAGSADLMMSTWATNQQNIPHAAATNVGPVTSMTGTADSVASALDRFWDIQTTAAVTADLTFSYRGIENTTASPLDTIRAQHWNGSSWDPQVAPGNPGVIAGVGTAGPFVGQTTFSPWILTIVPTCPQAFLAYNDTVCETDTTQNANLIGSTGGVFSSTPAGLDLDTITGDYVPSNSTPGTYFITYTIDSTVVCPVYTTTDTITILPTVTGQTTASVCQGDSILLGGAYQNAAGTYYDTLSTAFGCDSILATTLSVVPIVTTTDSVSICQGDSIFIGGGWQNTSGMYSDTLTSSNSCDSIVQTVLDILPIPTIPVVSADSLYCLGDNIVITGNGSGGTINWYSDPNGTNLLDTGNIFQPSISSPGVYTYYFNEVVGQCSSAIDSVQIVVGGVTAVINANPTSGVVPLNVFFGNGSTPGVSYYWDFGTGDTSTVFEPSYTYNDVGEYVVMLIVTDGVCSDTAYVTIEVVGESVFIIPNVFTPNGDGNNDFFTVEAENIESIDGEIFNRWGEKMFSWNNINGAWDGKTLSGKDCPDGTYFFIIKAVGVDGKEYMETGTFSLIR